MAYQQARVWESVRERCRALAVEARGRIAALAGLPRIAPVESSDGYRWFRQMSAAPLPDGIDGKALKRRLYDEYRVEVPMTWWNEKPFLRVSFQGYNTRNDLDALMTALENLLPKMTPVM